MHFQFPPLYMDAALKAGVASDCTVAEPSCCFLDLQISTRKRVKEMEAPPPILTLQENTIVAPVACSGFQREWLYI